MTDEAYTFFQDARDKKSVAASAYRKNVGHKGCKLPYESIPYNQRSKLNGEVKVVANLDRPMTWEEFKSMPKDLQEKYLNRLKELYQVPNNRIGAMMGAPGKKLDNYITGRKLKVIAIKGHVMTWQQQCSWDAFCNGVVGGGHKDEMTIDEKAEVLRKEYEPAVETTHTGKVWNPVPEEVPVTPKNIRLDSITAKFSNVSSWNEFILQISQFDISTGVNIEIKIEGSDK